jgi:predicted dienelactone hydrolase
MTDEATYDPFVRGGSSVGVRTIEAFDATRNRTFPCEIWSPEAMPGPRPLVVFSHSSGGGRRQSTFLCTHLASHGYVVAAMDHSEIVAPELARQDGETPEQTTARRSAWVESRVPDVRFLLDHLLASDAALDPERVAIVGHSFGGWTALAATEADRRIRSVVALAPGGSSRPRPGILQATLAFAWGRDVPTLYLVAENDVSLPLDGMVELFERTPATKRMVILSRADHLHFMDDVETRHEAVRAMPWPEELAWLPKEMRPVAELCSGDEAHAFVRGLTLSHLDATVRQRENAERFLTGDLRAELAARGVDAIVYEP